MPSQTCGLERSRLIRQLLLIFIGMGARCTRRSTRRAASSKGSSARESTSGTTASSSSSHAPTRSSRARACKPTATSTRPPRQADRQSRSVRPHLPRCAKISSCTIRSRFAMDSHSPCAGSPPWMRQASRCAARSLSPTTDSFCRSGLRNKGVRARMPTRHGLARPT